MNDDQDAPRVRRIRVPRGADTAFFLVGIALLVWTLSSYSLGDLGRACAKLGPRVAWTPFIALGWISCNTAALYLLLDGQVPWLRLLRIRLVGDGYNALLPLVGLGGEPYKVKHIAATVPVERVLAALIRDRVMENAVGLLFTALGLALALGKFVFAPSVRVAVVGYVAGAAVGGTALALVMVTRLPGSASAWIARRLGVATQADVRLPRRQFALVLVFYVAARVAGCLEATVLLGLLGVPFDPVTILFAYSLPQAAGFIGFAIPAGIGVFESAAVFVFDVIGYPGPLGVAFALARRARMLVVGLVGVALHLASAARDSGHRAVGE